MCVRAEDSGAVKRLLLALFIAFASLAAHAEVRVTDDAGQPSCSPHRRNVSSASART